MKKQIKGFILLRGTAWDEESKYTWAGCEMPQNGYVTVMPHSIEVDIPDDFDPRNAQVEMLKAEKQKAMADFQALVTSIDRKISELTALEYVA